MLEQVREPGAPGVLVGRAHVVPEVHRRDRDALLAEDDLQPVGQRVLLERQVDTRRGAGQAGAGEQPARTIPTSAVTISAIRDRRSPLVITTVVPCPRPPYRLSVGPGAQRWGTAEVWTITVR